MKSRDPVIFVSELGPQGRSQDGNKRGEREAKSERKCQSRPRQRAASILAFLIQHMFCRDESVLHSDTVLLPSFVAFVSFPSLLWRQWHGAAGKTYAATRAPAPLSLVPLSLFVLGQVHLVLVPLFCVPMCAYLLTSPLPHPVCAAVLYI